MVPPAVPIATLPASKLGTTRAVGNFSAGPACLPEDIMFKAQMEFCNFGGTGMSIMDMSHRDAGGPVQNIISDATTNIRTLLAVPSNFKILWKQKGAHGQFSAVPLNLLGEKLRLVSFPQDFGQNERIMNPLNMEIIAKLMMKKWIATLIFRQSKNGIFRNNRRMFTYVQTKQSTVSSFLMILFFPTVFHL